MQDKVFIQKGRINFNPFCILFLPINNYKYFIKLSPLRNHLTHQTKIKWEKKHFYNKSIAKEIFNLQLTDIVSIKRKGRIGVFCKTPQAANFLFRNKLLSDKDYVVLLHLIMYFVKLL